MVLLHKWVFRISNTPGTKFIKFGLKCPILHFEMDKTIKFERIFFSLEHFLESLQEIRVKDVLSLNELCTKFASQID